MQVSPQNAPADMRAGVEHMMMIVPVDPKVDKAKHVTHEHRKKRRERFEVIAMWNLQLENHDRDNDRENTVAERFKSVLAHARN
jgi:hypothetical protein